MQYRVWRLMVLAAFGLRWGLGAFLAVGQSSTPTPPWSIGARALVTADYLNMRAEPGADATLVGTLTKGAEVTVVGTSDAEPNWVRVRGEDQFGWVSTRYLERSDALPLTATATLPAARTRPPSATQRPTTAPPAPTSQGEFDPFRLMPGNTDSERINYFIETMTRSQIGVWFLVAVVVGFIGGRWQGNKPRGSKPPAALWLPLVWAGVGLAIFAYQSLGLDPANILAYRLSVAAGAVFAVVASLCTWIGVWTTRPGFLSMPVTASNGMSWEDYDRVSRQMEENEKSEPRRDWLEEMIVGTPKRRDGDDD